RLGDLHRRQHSLRVGDRAAADRGPAGAVRLRRCHGAGGGDAADLVPDAAADQPGAALEPSPRPGRMSGAGVPALRDPPWVRHVLVGGMLLFLAAFLGLPLVLVFREAFAGGWATYVAALTEPDARAAIRLTLTVAAIAVPLNVVFGLAAGWALTRFRFRGKSLLVTLIDLPFSVSPVVAGLMLLLLFGNQGWFQPLVQALDLKIVFAVPGIVLATLFVTFPFVARELIAFMEEQSVDPEEAAFTLGAGGWRTFWHVTLPTIRWSLLYGVLLCNARAMGEFGAVSV